MTNQNNAAQAADTTPFSDEYVNAVIQQHGYDSPECVIARLHQWIGLHGGENGLTLLMYEAHKALIKLRAPVADEDDQPTAPDDDAIAECWVTASDCDGIAYDGPSFERGYRMGEIAERDRAALASAPADERAALHHVANEWADMATCAIQWIRNIKNGVSTPEAALENLMSNLTHCQEVQSCAGVRLRGKNAPCSREAVACLRRQREGSDWGHWTPATVEDGQRVTGLRSWQVRWLVDATPEAIADGLTVEIRLPNGTNISGWMKMASQAHLSAAPVECPPVAGERAFQLVQDLRAFAAMQRWFGEHGYDSVGASGRLAVSNALFARLCAALSAQPAEKPATSAPSPAASQRQAMVPGSQESGNSHTDGGAVYA